MAKNELSALESLRARYSYLEKEDGELSALERLKKGYTYLIPENERADYGPPELETAAPAPKASLWDVARAGLGSSVEVAQAGIPAAAATGLGSLLETPSKALGMTPFGALADAAGVDELYNPWKSTGESLRQTGTDYLSESMPDVVAAEENLQRTLESQGNTFGGKVAAGIGGSLSSVAPLAAGIGTGILTKDPLKAAAAMKVAAVLPATQAYAASYVEGKREGMSDEEAHAYGLAQAGSEYLFETLSPGAGKTIAATLAKRTLGEGAQEGATEAFQQDISFAAEKLTGKNVYNIDSSRDAIENIAVAGTAGALMGGALSTPTAGAETRDYNKRITKELDVIADNIDDPEIASGIKAANEVAEQAEAQVQSMLGKSIYPKISKTLDLPKDAKSTEIDLGQVVEMSTDTLPSIKPVEDRAADVEVIDDLTGFSETPVRDTTARDAQLQELQVRRDHEQKVIAQQESNVANPQLSEGGRKRAANKLIQAQGRLEKIKQLETELTGFVPETQTDTELTLNNAPVASTKAVAPLAPVAATPVSAVTPEAAVEPVVKPAAVSEIDLEADPESQREIIEQVWQKSREETKTIENETAEAQVLQKLSPDVQKLVAGGTARVVREDDAKVIELINSGEVSATGNGFFDGKNIYIRAENIAKQRAAGEKVSEQGVALHEIKHYMDRKAGSVEKRSLKSILGDEGNVRVVSRIEQLAKSGNTVASKAIERANKVKPELRNDELPAYFIEEAAIQAESGTIGRAGAVIRDIISMAKAKLADFGLDLNLSENDIYYLGRQLAKEAAKPNKGKTEPKMGTLESQAAPMFRFNEPGRNLRGKVGNSTISYAMNDKGEANLNLIRTPQEHRGKGEARKALKSFLREADNNRVPVTLTVAEQSADTDGARLQEFYESEGFKVVGKARDGSPKMRREADVILESRTKAEQPRRVERVNKEVPSATVEQNKTARRLDTNPAPKQMEKLTVARTYTKTNEETPIYGPGYLNGRIIPGKLWDNTKTAFQAIADGDRGGMRDFQGKLEGKTGSDALAVTEAKQWSNVINTAVNKYPMNQRGRIRRLMNQITFDLGKRADAKARRDAAWKELKDNFPAVFETLNEARVAVRRNSLDIIRGILDSGKALSKKDLANIKTINEKLDFYVTEVYASLLPGRVGQLTSSTKYEAWKTWQKALKKDPKATPSSDALIFENARKWIRDKELWLPHTIIEKKALDPESGDRPMTLPELEALHAFWVKGSESQAIPLVDSTVDQQDAYRDKLIDELIAKRAELEKDGMYDKELNEKATTATLEMLGLYGDAATFLHQRYGIGNMDRSILKNKTNLPAPLKDLLGRLVDPVSRIETTLLKQGMLLSQQRFLNTLYRDGMGEYFVEEADRGKDGKFTEKLSGEALGPLNGLFATPRMKQVLDQYNAGAMGIQNAFSQLLSTGSVSNFNEALFSTALRALGKVAGWTKFGKVILNFPARIPLNYLGSQMVVVQNGVFSTKLPEYELRAHKAFFHLLSPESGRLMTKRNLTPEEAQLKKDISTILKYEVSDSAQVGELQRMAREVRIEEILGDNMDISGKRSVKKIARTAKEVLVNGVAGSDQIGKFTALFHEQDVMTEFAEKMGLKLTEDEIAKIAADRVKATNIQLSRSAPGARALDRLGLSMFLPYFTSTYQSIYYSGVQAFSDVMIGRELKKRHETAAAGDVLVGIGTSRAIGTAMSIAFNRALIRPALLGIAGMMLLDADEDDEERRNILEDAMNLLEPGTTLLWQGNSNDGSKAGFFDVGELSPVDPVQTTIAALYENGPSEAIKATLDLFFANSGTAMLWSGLLGKGDRRASMETYAPTAYEKLIDNVVNGTPVPRWAADSAIRVFDTMMPNVAKSKVESWFGDADPDSYVKGLARVATEMGARPRVFDLTTVAREVGKMYEPLTDRNSNVFSQDRAKFIGAIQTANPSRDSIQAAYAQILDQEMETFQKARKLVYAAQHGLQLGDDADDKIIEAVKQRTSKAVAENLVDNVFEPSVISSRVLDGSLKQELEKAKDDEAKIAKLEAKYDMISEIVEEMNESLGEKDDQQ